MVRPQPLSLSLSLSFSLSPQPLLPVFLSDHFPLRLLCFSVVFKYAENLTAQRPAQTHRSTAFRDPIVLVHAS